MFKVNGEDVVIFNVMKQTLPRGAVDFQNEITIELDKILLKDNGYKHGFFPLSRSIPNNIIRIPIRIIDENVNKCEVGCLCVDETNCIISLHISYDFYDNYNIEKLEVLIEKYKGKKLIDIIYQSYYHDNTVRLAGKDPESLVNGEGLRKVIFFQGCSLNCKGCFNDCTHDFKGGEEFKISEVLEDIYKDNLIDGVTFSGGNPVQQPYALACLIYKCKSKKNLNVWLYTGYTFEELLEKASKNIHLYTAIYYSDVIVDGRFIEEEKDEGLKYKGSKNQRIIDVKKTLLTGNIVEWSEKYGGLQNKKNM